MSWSELYLGPGHWILAVLAGAVLGMDAVSWPQVMVSRPLVSATIGGWLLGNPVAGMLVGLVLEIYALRHPPFGAAKYPDTGPA
ncbi:PTS sugar transporter subunit IIC, partial [Gemmatimonadota bacterium]